MREGIKPMGRNLVHLSLSREVAEKVGSRHGDPVVLIIDAKRYIADGKRLFLSPNGFWQAEFIDSRYIKKL